MESLRSFAPLDDRRGEGGDAREPLRGQGNVRVRHRVARYLYLSTAVVLVQSRHGISVSRRTCRAPARDAGKANSYQPPFQRLAIIGPFVQVMNQCSVADEPVLVILMVPV